MDAEAVDQDREALRAQAGTMAGGARLLGHVFLDPPADLLGIGFVGTPLEVVDDAFEAHAVGAATAEAVPIGDGVALVACPVEEDLAVLRVELRPRRIRVDL